MKKTVCALVIHLPVIFMAQESVRGRLQDSTGTALPFAVVALLKAADSSIVKGTMSDDIGRYELPGVGPGKYFLKATLFGYREALTGVFTKDSLHDAELPPLVLGADGRQLSQVDVVAMRDPLEFKNGNVILTVDGSPLALGNSVFDLLTRLPGVMIENDNIIIQGKSGARVYIDERPQQMSGLQLISFLRSLNASDVEKIEVILNPPARYDAAGNAGIINIKLKRVRLTGFSGGANLSASQGAFLRSNGGFSLNYKGRKYAVFSSINANTGITEHVTSFDRNITSSTDSYLMRQRSAERQFNQDLVGNLGLDVYLTAKTTAGARFQAIPGYATNQLTGRTEVEGAFMGYDLLTFTKDTPNDWYLANYNLNAEHKLDTLGSVLKLSADYYGPYFDDYASYYHNGFTDAEGVDAKSPSNFISNNLLGFNILSPRSDLTLVLPKKYELECGVKASWQRAYSNYVFQYQDTLAGSYHTDTTLTNVFIYNERIYAGYVNVEKTVGEFRFHAGTRAEDTGITTESQGTAGYSRTYFNLFPLASIDYNPASGYKFSISYNRRIDRPHYNSFNPYRWFDNLLVTGEGNPYLSPAYSHNFSLNTGYKGIVNNTLSYTRITNPIMHFPVQDDESAVISYRVDNMRYLNIVRCNLFFRKSIKKWWTLGALVGAYYIDFTGPLNGVDFSTSAIPHYEWLSSTFLLPKNFKIEFSGFYWGPWLGAGSINLERGGLNLAVRKSFLDSKLNCSIAFNDIFFTEPFRSTAKFRNQDWQRKEAHDTRRVNLSVSYNFGKIKAEQRNVESAQEEKARLGK